MERYSDNIIIEPTPTFTNARLEELKRFLENENVPKNIIENILYYISLEDFDRACAIHPALERICNDHTFLKEYFTNRLFVAFVNGRDKEEIRRKIKELSRREEIFTQKEWQDKIIAEQRGWPNLAEESTSWVDMDQSFLYKKILPEDEDSTLLPILPLTGEHISRRTRSLLFKSSASSRRKREPVNISYKMLTRYNIRSRKRAEYEKMKNDLISRVSNEQDKMRMSNRLTLAHRLEQVANFLGSASVNDLIHDFKLPEDILNDLDYIVQEEYRYEEERLQDERELRGNYEGGRPVLSKKMKAIIKKMIYMQYIDRLLVELLLSLEDKDPIHSRWSPIIRSCINSPFIKKFALACAILLKDIAYITEFINDDFDLDERSPSNDISLLYDLILVTNNYDLFNYFNPLIPFEDVNFDNLIYTKEYFVFGEITYKITFKVTRILLSTTQLSDSRDGLTFIINGTINSDVDLLCDLVYDLKSSDPIYANNFMYVILDNIADCNEWILKSGNPIQAPAITKIFNSDPEDFLEIINYVNDDGINSVGYIAGYHYCVDFIRDISRYNPGRPFMKSVFLGAAKAVILNC